MSFCYLSEKRLFLMFYNDMAKRMSLGMAKVKKALEEVGYSGWVTAEMIPQYVHYTDQIVYNTSSAMDRILAGC